MSPQRASNLTLTGIAIAAALTSASAARAAEADRYDGLSLSLEAQAGRTMPLGYYGLALDLSLSPPVALSAGVGFSYEANYGAARQAMIASRYRYPFGGGWAVAAGGGMSFGTFKQDTYNSMQQHTHQEWRPAVRVNAELSLEYRLVMPLNLRVFAGVGYIVNDPTCYYVETPTVFDGPCDAAPPSRRDYDRTPTFYGVALAYQVAGDPVATAARKSGHTPIDATAAPGSLWARWYGWQTLTADALAAGLFYATSETNSEWDYASQGASGVIYFAGAPAVHLAHRSPLRSVLSLAMRIGLPLLLAVTLWENKSNSECRGLECSFVQGMLAGAIIASFLDATVISYR